MNLRRLFNPWGHIRHLEAELVDTRAGKDYWRGQAALLADRYDKIRETSAQLREALSLYRNNS